MRDVYAEAEAKIRQLLLARPKARGQGRAKQFLDRTVALGVLFLRKHGPYGNIFSACYEALARLLGFKTTAVRNSIKALLEIGLLKFLPRANGHERKWRSVEFAAFQYQLGPEFATFFLPSPNAMGTVAEKVLGDLPISVALPARTWDRARPEFRLPSKGAIRRAATASLEALQRLPLPRLSVLALATLARPGGSLR
jgi:hypothetical protein